MKYENKRALKQALVIIPLHIMLAICQFLRWFTKTYVDFNLEIVEAVDKWVQKN